MKLAIAYNTFGTNDVETFYLFAGSLRDHGLEWTYRNGFFFFSNFPVFNFRRAEDVDPRNPKTHFLLAKTLFAKNDRHAAQTEIDQATKLKPNQPEFIALKHEIEGKSQ